MKLAELIGTEKQISFAQDVRAKIISKQFEPLLEEIALQASEGLIDSSVADKGVAAIEKLLEEASSSRWWIDHQHSHNGWFDMGWLSNFAFYGGKASPQITYRQSHVG